MFICVCLTLFTLALANTASPTFVSCLKNSGLKTEVPQNATWTNSTTPFNKRFSYSPSAIIYPTQTTDVSEAVKCAVKFGIHVSALSGGHSYSASGYGSQNGSLVIMFRDMAQITYSPSDGTVAVEPGARLGDVALELNDNGRALAHGVCPYVGIGGHGAFGGWGFASRNWGLLIDQVAGAVLVLSNGSVVDLNATQHPDLFWAIRGAASSFGIVTRYTLHTHQAPANVVRYSYGFNNPNLSSDVFAKLLSSYQTWGRTAPKELGIEANIWNGGRLVELGGYYMGNLNDFNRISASLLQATGPPSTTYVQQRSWVAALTEVNGGSPLSTLGKPDVVPLAQYFANAQIPNTMSWFIQFELWGGGDSVISSLPANATAYPHRAHLWTIQFYARSTTSWPAQGTDFVNSMVSAITNSMQGTTFGAYANYLDPELIGWRNKYYAENYGRLASLQKMYDPRGVFMKAQNIGAPDL
ncbi:FAD-binding domain-containing protein [Mycena rosella]|uniref:FAD-binding domain-containing protein n=1 Tax=Mycena rosella TaxID=1033263 RepID=A0AAD7GKL4_MYCRO|nr:FAD-binding domain-containing protein [Mycena rosella]